MPFRCFGRRSGTTGAVASSSQPFEKKALELTTGARSAT